MQNQKLRAKYVPCESPEGNFFSKVDGWSTRVDYPLQAKAESRRDSVTELVLMMATGMLSSVQFSHSVMSDFVTPWTAGYQASLSITNSQSLLRLMSIESVMPYNHLILCHPLLPSFFPSIRAFPMSQFFTSGGQSTGASASALVSQSSHSVMSDSLQPHGLQDARPLCPSPTPRVYSDSSLLSRWCHPTISSI